MRISNEFQKRFKELSDEININKVQIAKQIGITYSTFSKIYNYGIVPRTAVLIQIADFFNVSIEFLLAMTDEEYFDKSKSHQTFRERLVLLKEKNSIKSYYSLSEKLHIDRKVISNWLHIGFLPEISNLELLSDFFDVSLDYLLGRTDYER